MKGIKSKTSSKNRNPCNLEDFVGIFLSFFFDRFWGGGMVKGGVGRERAGGAEPKGERIPAGLGT